jgi:hypothetical protein
MTTLQACASGLHDGQPGPHDVQGPFDPEAALMGAYQAFHPSRINMSDQVPRELYLHLAAMES